VIIGEGRIAAAACLLPLSTDDHVSRHFGTRHRAAIGLTRETDAAVIVVSEERGIVSLVVDGEVTVMFDQNELRDKLAGLLNLKVSGQEDRVKESLDAA
jgi:DNA integrity scanning protein DisA with diadenylate cyclase activity